MMSAAAESGGKPLPYRKLKEAPRDVSKEQLAPVCATTRSEECLHTRGGELTYPAVSEIAVLPSKKLESHFFKWSAPERRCTSSSIMVRAWLCLIKLVSALIAATGSEFSGCARHSLNSCMNAACWTWGNVSYKECSVKAPPPTPPGPSLRLFPLFSLLLFLTRAVCFF